MQQNHDFGLDQLLTNLLCLLPGPQNQAEAIFTNKTIGSSNVLLYLFEIVSIRIVLVFQILVSFSVTFLLRALSRSISCTKIPVASEFSTYGGSLCLWNESITVSMVF